METHRLTPSISGPLPRVSPSQGCELAGFFIPAGVRVSGQAYSLHKEERVFGGDAGEWQPDRWLTADEEKGKEMRRWMWQFGGGGRGCLGQHFATLCKYQSLSCGLFTPTSTSGSSLERNHIADVGNCRNQSGRRCYIQILRDRHGG